MYLTRTKMLVAALLLAGTFSIGIGSRHLPSAEAQAPPADPNAASVKKAIDWLKANPPQPRWEYKFLPVPKPLSSADLQKVLNASDREGWEYCGTQELTGEVKAKDMQPGSAGVPHMVFKRPRQAGTDDRAAVAALELLAAQEEQARKAEYARRIAEAEKTYREALELTDPKKKAEKDRGEQEAVRKAMEAEIQAAIKKQLEDRAYAEAERDRANELIHRLQAEQKVLIERLKELEKSGRPAVGAALDVPAPQTTSLVLALTHIRAEDALELLNEAAAKETCKVSLSPPSNAIKIQGPSEGVARLKELVEKTIDRKPTENVLAPPGSVEIAVIPLRHIDVKAASDAISKALPGTRAAITGQSATNSLIVAGTADDLRAVRKVIESADRAPASPRKGK
jgi:hypothetical protein